MRLCRFGAPGAERPGLLAGDAPGGAVIDVSAFGEDFDERFFASAGPKRLGAWYRDNGRSCPTAFAGARLGPAVCRPSKIVCIGLNYRGHAEETGARIPDEPLIFLKATTALSGPFDAVVIPRGAEKTDWEVELAVVIGTRTRYVPRSRALDVVAGYALMNDYSERAFQRERGGQFTKGKSCDTFAPLGPYMATPDLIDPGNVRLWLKVNDQIRQSASTADMIFDVPTLISYVSEFMTLLPGDIISTGTPAGVGLGMSPPQFLHAGDVVEYGADGLGTARQEMVAFAGDAPSPAVVATPASAGGGPPTTAR